MRLTLQIRNKSYRVDLSEPLDISIPLDFHGAQPNAYGVAPAAAKACEAGSLIGDTRRGGSCNFEEYRFIPHCNGTHTEGVGHLTNERISIRDALRDAFIPATLITIEPEKADATRDTYSVNLDKEDLLITENALQRALENADENFLEGLIIRTLPNDESKKSRKYLAQIPPFFSLEAIRFIAGKGVKHLLADLPSIDRIFDEGRLAAHRVFWNMTEGSFETNESVFFNHTVTELIYVPDSVPDGNYLLNLQIAPFVADAAPSRPILYGIIE